MQTNGHHGQVPQPDHTSILVHIAEQVGEIRADVREVKRRVSIIERAKSPRSEWSTPVLCSLLLAAAAGGKITWSEALPTMLGLFAR